MDITRTPQTAYCYANGEIIWARTEPPGAIPISPELVGHPLYHEAILKLACISRYGDSLVIPELYSRKSYLEALILFEARVRLYCEQKRI